MKYSTCIFLESLLLLMQTEDFIVQTDWQNQKSFTRGKSAGCCGGCCCCCGGGGGGADCCCCYYYCLISYATDITRQVVHNVPIIPVRFHRIQVIIIVLKNTANKKIVIFPMKVQNKRWWYGCCCCGIGDGMDVVVVVNVNSSFSAPLLSFVALYTTRLDLNTYHMILWLE